MTLYELDHSPEDLVQSLYFPDVSGTLECTMWVCFSVGDDDLDGWIDDIDDRSSSAYSWPTQYQGDCDTVDNCERVCSPNDPNVPCKRVDATIRLGGIEGFYPGDLCELAYIPTMCEPPVP